MECNVHVNYNQAIDKVAQIYRMWENGNLSLYGKTLIVNTLAASQFLYKFQCLPSPPQKVIETFEKLTRDFIWSHKKPKNIT